VDCFIGSEERHWRLHCNLLAYHSEPLQNELQKQWDEAKSKDSGVAEPSDVLRLDLPEEDPVGFELLVKWLYQGKLEDVSEIFNSQDKYTYAVSCHKLYMLCARFELNELRDRAIDQYRKGLDQAELVPDSEEISEIYQRSPAGSPFRALMTRIAARQIMDPDNDNSAESYHNCFTDSPEFAIQLVNAIKEGIGGVLLSDPTEGETCEYHDHHNGGSCYRQGSGKFDEIQFISYSQDELIVFNRITELEQWRRIRI
jgi:hypothetical protein